MEPSRARRTFLKETNTLLSLDMIIDRAPDGAWRILAPWLDEPVTAPTFEEAYEIARYRFFLMTRPSA